MIELKVESYCHNCHRFEPFVDCITTKEFNDVALIERTNVNTTIKCKHRHQCKSLYEHLEHEYLNKRIKNGGDKE